jgi:hypothetical protein
MPFGGSGGVSGLMYVLRGSAERAQRGEGPSPEQLYQPAELRAARRRLLLVWVLGLSWTVALVVSWLMPFVVVFTIIGIVVAVATLIEPTWVGSPIRPWVALAIPVALAGTAATIFISG